jgi:hypothetical protein
MRFERRARGLGGLARALGLLAGAALLFAGCAAPTGKGAGRAPEGRWARASHQPLGGILLVDTPPGTALVELHFGAGLSGLREGTALVARDAKTLEPTARLELAAYRQGRVFAVYVREGGPRVGDEVALPLRF